MPWGGACAAPCCADPYGMEGSLVFQNYFDVMHVLRWRMTEGNWRVWAIHNFPGVWQ